MWGKRADTIVHERSPFNAEAAATALSGDDITALDVFYCRNHGPIPDISTDDWQLDIDGLVTNPVSVTFDQLISQFKAHRVVATLQCAGNRRAEFNEIREIAGEDLWGSGATSTAEWRGARLTDVLDAAGARRGGDMHAAFLAPDVSALASPAQPYGGSIPLVKAMSDEVLLAWEMNDRPLPRIHGGPVRVLVPGYIGARSVKWISRITVQNMSSHNYFQAFAYRILPPDCDPESVGPDTGVALSSVALNCDILVPENGAQVEAGPLTIGGYALVGGDHGIARVEVSFDDGRTWRVAKLAPLRGRWAWRRWTLRVDAEPGPLSVTARAWDTAGATQPESAASLWNPKGYANNAWARARIAVSKPAGY